MADIHAAKGDYEDAAKVLEKVKLEQTKREVTPADKAGTWLQIADYWFDAEDSVNAETYINKAAHLMHHPIFFFDSHQDLIYSTSVP